MARQLSSPTTGPDVDIDRVFRPGGEENVIAALRAIRSGTGQPLGQYPDT